MDGKLALLAAREYGLVTVDITNPASPQVLAHADVGEDEYAPTDFNKAYSIALQNNIAYVGVNNMDPSSALDNGSAEIYGFDYSNPSHPRLVSLMGDGSPEDYVMALWVSPNRLIAAGASEVRLFDLTRPRNVIGTFPFPNQLLSPQDPGSITPAAISGRGPLKPNVALRFPAQQRQPPKPNSQSTQPRWTPWTRWLRLQQSAAK